MSRSSPMTGQTSLSRDCLAQYPFKSRWMDIDGRRMHYVDEGPVLDELPSVETLLFVHGNPTWSYHWRNLILNFRNRYRCVAVDHLGCGLSDKGGPPLSLEDHINHLSKCIDQLDVGAITLVAQDWGGAIGLGTMLRRADQLKRIVLFNTGAYPPPSIPWRIQICRMPLIGRWAVQGMNLFARTALRMALSCRTHLEDEVAKSYLAPYHSWQTRQAIYDFVADIPGSPNHPTWSTLAEIEAGLPSLSIRPACLIWGMRDWCFTPSCLDRFVNIWPEAVVHRLDDVGHWVVEDAPERALEFTQAFLDNDLSAGHLPTKPTLASTSTPDSTTPTSR
ncbi:MAG: alpha/beta fold hydrolase [Pirellulales bacterium]|nr:alpha/beta fold hydrolase [Pirellulales bacterium]